MPSLYVHLTQGFFNAVCSGEYKEFSKGSTVYRLLVDKQSPSELSVDIENENDDENDEEELVKRHDLSYFSPRSGHVPSSTGSTSCSPSPKQSSPKALRLSSLPPIGQSTIQNILDILKGSSEKESQNLQLKYENNALKKELSDCKKQIEKLEEFISSHQIQYGYEGISSTEVVPTYLPVVVKSVLSPDHFFNLLILLLFSHV